MKKLTIALIVFSCLRPIGCTALAQDIITDTTPPQPPPIVLPAPDPRCEIALAPAGTSNFIRIALGPMLSKTIARSVQIDVQRDGAGAVVGGTVQIYGTLTPAQLGQMWTGIKSQWALPAGVAARDVTAITLAVTNGGTGRAEIQTR